MLDKKNNKWAESLENRRKMTFEVKSDIYQEIPPFPREITLDINKGINSVENMVVKAKQAVDKQGGNFTFVYLPSRDTLLSPNGSNKYIKRLISKLKEQNIPVINMYEIMIKADHPTTRFFYFGIENHYNGLGYKLVADSIVDAIY